MCGPQMTGRCSSRDYATPPTRGPASAAGGGRTGAHSRPHGNWSYRHDRIPGQGLTIGLTVATSSDSRRPVCGPVSHRNTWIGSTWTIEADRPSSRPAGPGIPDVQVQVDDLSTSADDLLVTRVESAC